MSSKKSKSDEKPSKELQALYKEYWATKTKFGQQIMDAMEQFGSYSDQVEAIQLREGRAIDVIYDKVEKQKQKESEGKKAASGSKKKKGKKSKRARSMKGGSKKGGCGSRRIVIGQAVLQPK
jgi:hypothetical protein